MDLVPPPPARPPRQNRPGIMATDSPTAEPTFSPVPSVVPTSAEPTPAPSWLPTLAPTKHVHPVSVEWLRSSTRKKCYSFFHQPGPPNLDDGAVGLALSIDGSHPASDVGAHDEPRAYCHSRAYDGPDIHRDHPWPRKGSLGSAAIHRLPSATSATRPSHLTHLPPRL